MKSSERTEVFYGVNNVIDIVIQFLDNTIKRIDACVDHTRPSLAIGIGQLRRSFLDAKKRGVKLRYVTEITEENISHCKELITMVDELRHLDGIHGNFYTSEKEYLAPATIHEKGKPASQIIYSNVKEIVDHQQYVFDSFWNRAIPAEQKIREIEEGVMPDAIEVIRDPSKIQEIYLNLVKNAKEEVMVILSTINAFICQEKIGIIRILEQVAEEHNVKVRILMPAHKLTKQTLKRQKRGGEEQLLQKPQQQQQPNQSQHTAFENNNYSNVEIRYIEQTSSTKSTFLVIDRKISLVMELKDDSRETFVEAVGLSIYSTSKPGVLSYVSIFENLWIQTEMYQQIKETNEQLKIHDKMQKEFINIASHEMKTPTQAILGYSDLLQHYPERRDEFIQAIYRNATRLQRLTDDILDVTRIESQSLKLNKEHVNLHNIISAFVDDYRIAINKHNSNVKLLYKPDSNEPPIFVNADRGRIIQVLSNLLSNSIKFTNEGSVSINAIISRKKNDQGREEAMITIKDTGSGIDPQILPRLFSKFASKSDSGTGLGLFISKSIIEAHGGRIWAINNKDGKGATLVFTLPLNEGN
jgi:signal transduction histidine kinase